DDKPWNIKISGRYVAKTKNLNMALKLGGFRPSSIANLAPQLVPLAAVELSVSGTVSMDLPLHDEAARMDRLTFDLKGEHGHLHIPDPVMRDYAVRSLAV